MPPLDLPELIEIQRGERYRAVVIHAPAIAGKTETARALAQVVPDARYLDLLDERAKRPDFAQQIDRFGLPEFERYLLQVEAAGQVVIVDHLDAQAEAGLCPVGGRRPGWLHRYESCVRLFRAD